MMQALALLLGRHAARVLDPVRPVQAAAMYAELEHLEGHKALGWALECLAASYWQRMSFLAVMIVGARLCVAMAAGLFGFVHVFTGFINMWIKIQMLAGETALPFAASHIRAIGAYSLEHWAWNFVLFGPLGMLHILAALMMAIGRNDRVLQLSVIVIGFDLFLPLAGMGGFTFPAIYVGLITLMALVSAGLAWLWRWDERRMARS